MKQQLSWHEQLRAVESEIHRERRVAGGDTAAHTRLGGWVSVPSIKAKKDAVLPVVVGKGGRQRLATGGKARGQNQQLPGRVVRELPHPNRRSRRALAALERRRRRLVGKIEAARHLVVAAR